VSNPRYWKKSMLTIQPKQLVPCAHHGGSYVLLFERWGLCKDKRSRVIDYAAFWRGGREGCKFLPTWCWSRSNSVEGRQIIKELRTVLDQGPRLAGLSKGLLDNECRGITNSCRAPKCQSIWQTSKLTLEPCDLGHPIASACSRIIDRIQKTVND
jgi:hypothetical protein